MSTVKKGLTVTALEWAKHLRPFGKRRFWKRQRAADRLDQSVRRVAAEREPDVCKIEIYRQRFAAEGNDT